MSQSRPVQWRSAISRAEYAISRVVELRRQWVGKIQDLQEELERLREERSRHVRDLHKALADLANLQNDYQYCRDQVPESLENSLYAEKLDDVLVKFSFDHRRGAISDEEKFPLEDVLEEALDNEYLAEPFIDILAELEDAQKFDLPKGFGRD